MAGIHKMLVRTPNREDPDQTASLIWVCTVCLGFSDRHTSVQNVRTLPYPVFL